MCRLRNIAMRDYQESVTTRQTDAGQSDTYVPLCFAGDTKMITFKFSCVVYDSHIINVLITDIISLILRVE